MFSELKQKMTNWERAAVPVDPSMTQRVPVAVNEEIVGEASQTMVSGFDSSANQANTGKFQAFGSSVGAAAVAGQQDTALPNIEGVLEEE